MRYFLKNLRRAETSVTVFPCKKKYLRYEIFISPQLTNTSYHADLEIVKSTISLFEYEEILAPPRRGVGAN